MEIQQSGFYAGYRFNRDKDRDTITDLGLSLIDQQNSYNLKTIENIFTAGANYHYDRKNGTKKLRTTLDINLPLSVIDRKTDYARSVVDTSLVQAPVFFEPSLSFSHIKWRGNNISSTLWSIKASTSLKYNMKNSYHRMKNYTASGITGEAQQIDNNSLHNYAHIQIRSYYKKISGGFKISADWRKPLNDQTNMGYNNTWDFKGDFWLSANLPGGVDWETECVLVKRQGYSSDELNEPACDWRIGLSKSFFKNKLGVSLKAIDILKQYKSVAYVVNERGIRETHAVSLPSYLLLNVTYKFNKQPSKK